MMTKKLLTFAVAGLLTPVALQGTADAGGRTTINKIIGSPEQDTAPVANGRLRRTDSEQAGHEMAAIVLLGDGTKGLWFDMATELPGVAVGDAPRRANHRVQASLIPFTLNQATDGAVQVTADLTKSTFVTDNDGDEYRNAHHIAAFALTKDIGCMTYNYQAQGGNDTKRYTQCFTADGAKVLNQSLIMAKNNDDCGTHQSGEGDSVTQQVGGKVYVVSWDGCNGNGSDDGWANFLEYDVSNPAAVTVKKMFDVSLAQREERTRGNCSIGTDPNTAICTWTEGNNQPARDGTWMAAIDITPGKFKGANAQGAILWKEMVEGRKDIDGIRTHSMRAAQQRVFAPDATGALKATDNIIWYSNDNRGNNNENEKGGYSVRTMMGVIKADKTGMSFVQPLADTSVMLRGLGGTHLGMVPGVFGTTDKLQPGVMFTNGSHTGGYFSGQARSLVWDQTALKFIDGGMTPTAVNDRHLYSNYLGNNPGNQGRNFQESKFVANPFLGKNGNTDAYLVLMASTGKDMAEMGAPEKKLSGYITVIPVASTPAVQPGTGSGSGSGSAGTPTPDPTAPPADETPADAGDSLGGCSTGGGSTGLATFLLIGLAAFIRRRR